MLAKNRWTNEKLETLFVAATPCPDTKLMQSLTRARAVLPRFVWQTRVLLPSRSTDCAHSLFSVRRSWLAQKPSQAPFQGKPLSPKENTPVWPSMRAVL